MRPLDSFSTARWGSARIPSRSFRAVGWSSDANDAASKLEQASVGLRSALVADSESPELVERALDDPAHFAQPGAVGDAATG